jgi:fatty acid desaturase
MKLVLETAAVYVLLALGSVWLAWTWLWPALLLALGLWLDRMYAVGHEAVHRKLFPDRPRLNDLVGAVMLAPLLAPLAVFRKIHAFHHGFNRKAPRVATLDVVYVSERTGWRRGVAHAYAYVVWLLAVFAGGFFLHSLVSVVLFLLLPTAVAARISPAFAGWNARLRLRAWLELLAGAAVHAVVWRLGGFEVWLAALGLPLLAFAWVWSLLLYVYHYRTTIGPQVRWNVRSLRRHPFMSWLLLNFNDHTTHHADPRIPWYLLPERRIAAPPEFAGNQRVTGLAGAILQQLRGPVFVPRPPPGSA